MSLAGKDLAKHRELKTTVIDIERIPGWVRAYDARVDYLPERMWEEKPKAVCFVAKSLGERAVEIGAVWRPGQDEEYLATRTWEIFDQNNLMVTYFGKGADVPWLRELWVKYKLGEPSPWIDIDLFSTIKGRLRLVHKNLNAACELAGVKGKNDHYDFRLADAAVAGDVKAQKRIERYNRGDVLATEALYWALLPHIKPHPHVAPNRYVDAICCPRCASRDVKRAGEYTPGVYVYAAYRCNTCLGAFKTEFQYRGPSVRAL